MTKKKVLNDEQLGKVAGGSWMVNGVLCDKYLVKNQQGEELSAIASTLGVTQTVLVSLNGLTKAGLMPYGTELFYPAK